MDASWLNEQWLESLRSEGVRDKEGSGALPVVRPSQVRWCHERHGITLPMPDAKLEEAMWQEVREAQPEAVLGHACDNWLKRVHQWLAAMVQRFQRNDGRVTGNWSYAAEFWKERLSRVRSGQELAELTDVVSEGGRLPFETVPAKPIRCFANHPNLKEKPDAVWDTVAEQLRVGAVVPFDVAKGLLVDGSRLHGGSLPWCMFSSRWVSKAGSTKVRVTCNGSPLKPFFAPESVSCELDTNEALRHLWREGDLFVSFDQCTSFYHYMYWPGHQTYVGASFHCSELPKGIGVELANRYPQAVLPEWSSRDGEPPTGMTLRAWKREAVSTGRFRIVLTYAGMLMGVSPSVAMLSKVMSALMDGWRMCTVGEGDTLERGRGGNYVDDSIFAAAGCFRNGLELSLRVALEYVILGFALNLKRGKSSLVPRPTQIFCGLLLDVRKGCWFSLSERRVLKLMAAIQKLSTVARVGYDVPLLAVARVVGMIWAIHVVAHRAVSIMCRGMIRILAVQLGKPELCEERNMARLKVLLKVAWRGSGPWTCVAESELRFWHGTEFRELRSRMRHDAVAADVRTWVAKPDGSVAADVRIFAVYSSETGSGGGEFIRDGSLWRMDGVTKIFVRLRDDEIGSSSCFRECKGVDHLDVAAIPAKVLRAVVVCDAMAAVSVLTRGSSIPELQELAAGVFRRQIELGRILFFCWASRDDAIIEACDDRSRFCDNHAFQTPPALFWRANELANKIFGQDFQVDAFADMHNVMPPDGSHKLPHFSRWLGPHTSGVDALGQDWSGLVLWANPPFPLLERLICALKAQRATAAVVVPRAARKPWSIWAETGAAGVAHVWPFDPRRQEFRMRGRTAPQRYRSGYAVVFFDFRSQRDKESPWRALPGARQLRLRSEREAACALLNRTPPGPVTWAQLGMNEQGERVGDGQGIRVG